MTDQLLQQRRVRFLDISDETGAAGSFRGRKIDRLGSFREGSGGGRRRSWLERQFSSLSPPRSSMGDLDSDYETAIAAAAYAITKVVAKEEGDQDEDDEREEYDRKRWSKRRERQRSVAQLQDQQQRVIIKDKTTTKTKSKKEDEGMSPPSNKPSATGSSLSKRFSFLVSQDDNADDKTDPLPKLTEMKKATAAAAASEIKPKSSVSPTTPRVKTPSQTPMSESPKELIMKDGRKTPTAISLSNLPKSPAGRTGLGKEKIGWNEGIRTSDQSPEAKATAYELAKMEEIKKRHEKVMEAIQEWEESKRTKAKSKLEKAQKEIERMRSGANAEFKNQMDMIDKVASGARAQAEERKRDEEMKTKEKANDIRSTGRVPRSCFCF